MNQGRRKSASYTLVTNEQLITILFWSIFLPNHISSSCVNVFCIITNPFKLHILNKFKPGMVAHASSLSIQKTEAGWSLSAEGLWGLCKEFQPTRTTWWDPGWFVFKARPRKRRGTHFFLFLLILVLRMPPSSQKASNHLYSNCCSTEVCSFHKVCTVLKCMSSVPINKLANLASDSSWMSVQQERGQHLRDPCGSEWGVLVMCKVSNLKWHSQLSQLLVKICEIKCLPTIRPCIHLTNLVNQKWGRKPSA